MHDRIESLPRADLRFARAPLTLRVRVLVAALAAALCASACLGEDGSVRHELSIPIPPVLQPTRSDATADYYTLVEKEGRQQALPDATLTPIIGYDGKWPGPTIVARRGRATKLTIENRLDRPTTTHNHGHKVEARYDGHPADFVWPGKSKEYVYPNDQNAGTYWYHDHTMGSTGRNVFFGLAGLYIIKDDIWDSFNFPSGNYDVPLIIQDRKFNGLERNFQSYLGSPSRTDLNDTNLSYPRIGQGGFGDTACVNGVCAHPGSAGPRMEVANRRYLFRVLNGSDERQFRIQFRVRNPEVGRDDGNLPFAVVASDGGLLPRTVNKFSLLVAPAERYAIVFDFARFPVGTIIEMQNTIALQPPAPADLPMPNVMQFYVGREEADTSSPLPGILLPIERFDASKADVRRTIVLGNRDSDAAGGLSGGGVSKWTINGKLYDPGRIDLRGKSGQTELWELKNEGLFGAHPIHVHLTQFQVLEYTGTEPPEEYGGWKDTLLIPDGGSAKIMMRWETFSGVYVFHCHTLIHEDTEMMAQIEIAP